MTAMDESRWRRVDDLFQQALDRDARERSAFLRDASGGDDALASEVRTLLEAHDRAGEFLDEPAHGGASRLLDLDAQAGLADPIGARFGPWRITRALAAGGMGAVYLAVRDDDAYRQEVAIKLVRRGMLGSSEGRRGELIRRFHIERQALANLDHPSIARLIDGGTSDDGRPYLVMEYIDGLPIDVYSNERSLSVRERVALFCAVCDAVQHAHQNLVIHRDLKPGNILVTAVGVPKLLDFGLAKLLDPRASDLAAQVTATGDFMGTFAYAAPEQVAAGGASPDTRSDVYALGMILYRILAGRHAYEISGPLSEVLHRITVEPPVAPSRVADDRGGLDADLDTIVLKALAKEPARRYESAGDLRADLERWLRGDPILARSDSGWYVLRKTMRRYGAPLALAAAFVLLVTGLAIFATVQAARLAEQRATLADALRVSNIERGRAIGMTGNTVLAEELIWREYLGPPERTPAESDADGLAHWALWELYLGAPCARTLGTELPAAHVIARSSDDRWLAIARPGHLPVVIDAATGTVARRIDHATGIGHVISFRPGSSQLAVAGSDATVAIWDVATGSIVDRMDFGGHVTRLAFSSSGRLLAAGLERAVVIWDLERRARLVDIPVPGTELTAVAFGPDESAIAVGGESGPVWLFDAATGEAIASFFPHGRMCNSVAFSPDNRYLAADTNGTSVAIIDLASHAVVAELEGAAGWISALAFHPARTNPYWLAGAGFDKIVRIWEVAEGGGPAGGPSGRLIRTFAGHNSPVNALSFTKGGEILASAAGDAGIREWELAETGCVTRWADPGTVFDVQITHDGSRVVSATADRDFAVRVRDARTGDVLRVVAGHRAAISSIALSPDGGSVVSSSQDRTTRRWSLDGEEGSAQWTHESGGMPSAVAWSPDGAVIAASEAGSIRMHRAADGEVLETVESAARRIPSLRFSPDGRFLAAVLIPQSSVLLIDRTKGVRTELAGQREPIRIVRFSPDGRLLASAGDDAVIRLWSIEGERRAECIAALESRQQGIFALAFSPDGTLLASSGRSGKIELWSVNARRHLATLPGHRDMVFNMTFAPDGKHLFSGGRDAAIMVWDLAYYDRHIEGNREYQSARTAQ